MDFFVEKSELLEQLNFARSAVEKKNSIPILSHLLLEAEGFELRITATDLEIAARTACRAKARAKGAAVVPGLRFLEIARSAPDGEIRCRELENHWVQVTYGKSSFKLVGLAKDDFPKFPAIPKPVARVNAGVLGDCVEKTSFAVSAEESRYVLNGALLKLRADRVIMVATDGHRLALVEREAQIHELKEESSVLIPRKALALLRRFAEEDAVESSIAISKDKSYIFFSAGSRIVAARLLTGEFPKYEAVLPKENGKVAELDREGLAAVVRRVSVLADERSPGVRLTLEKNQLEVSASSPEYGEANEILETHYEQEGLQIGFNANYLLEFLGAVGATNSVLMQVKNAESAAEFQPCGDGGEHYRYILMPLRF